MLHLFLLYLFEEGEDIFSGSRKQGDGLGAHPKLSPCFIWW